ncbi:hypothetical protein AMTRI_Chr02g215430 [Amborella trichopoda]
MRYGDCRKDEEAMILDPAPRDGTSIKGVSGDLVSKVDSGAAYRVVSGSGFAEMHAKDNNMKEDNGAAFRVLSAYGCDSGYSLMPVKDNISFCIDLQNASSVHSISCFDVFPAPKFLSKKDGLLASHGNVQAKVMGHNLLGCVSSSTEDSREAAHIGKVLGVRSSAPCNDINHVIDSGGVANDAEYGQSLSYVYRDGYGLHAPTAVGEHADQSPVREAFLPLVVGSKHTIDGNIGSQPIAGSGKGKEVDATPWKKKHLVVRTT